MKTKTNILSNSRTSNVSSKLLFSIIAVVFVILTIMFSTVTVSGKEVGPIEKGLQSASLRARTAPVNVAHAVNASLVF